MTVWPCRDVAVYEYEMAYQDLGGRAREMSFDVVEFRERLRPDVGRAVSEV